MSFENQGFENYWRIQHDDFEITRNRSDQVLRTPNSQKKIKKFKKFRLLREMTTEKIGRSHDRLAHSLSRNQRKANELIFIEKSIKSPGQALKRYKSLAKKFLLKSGSSKRCKSLKSFQSSPKDLLFKPAKNKLPPAIKSSPRDYQFLFDLEDGIMKSACIICN